MTQSDRFAARFAVLAQKKEGAFVPFVNLCDPTPEISSQILEALAAGGADALELGIPFSDPCADGPVIEASAQRALAAGSTTAKCLGIIKAFRAKHPDIPVSLMLYVNLVTAPGVEHFFAAAKAHGIHLIAIAPPNGTPDLYKEVAQRSTGYVYLLSRAGITGTDKTAGRPGEAEIAALRAAGSAPLLLGFGVSRPEHVRAALEAGADGAIAGSAVAQVITENLSNVPVMLERLTAFVKEMKAATALR